MQTDDIYTKMKRWSNGYKLLFTVLSIVLLSSCTNDEDAIPDIPGENGLSETTIRLDVATFDQTNKTDTRSYVEGNSDENRINDIWVFQYNAKTGESLHTPVYLDNFDSSNIDVNLTLNEDGEQSLVCIVANVGKEIENGEEWALDANGNTKAGFDTYDKLLKQSLPEAASRPFISSNMGDTGGKVIPMFGVSKAIAVVSKCYVSVPLVRMFARVDVKVDLSYPHEVGMKIDNISFCNIPYYCRVETLASDDDYHYTAAANYPVTVTWDKFDAGDANEVILYLPENLQGIVMGMTGKQETAEAKIPEHALCIELVMSYDNGTKTHTYNIYPGFDMEHDFNIMRNHIFNVSIKITKLPE